MQGRRAARARSRAPAGPATWRQAKPRSYRSVQPCAPPGRCAGAGPANGRPATQPPRPCKQSCAPRRVSFATVLASARRKAAPGAQQLAGRLARRVGDAYVQLEAVQLLFARARSMHRHHLLVELQAGNLAAGMREAGSRCCWAPGACGPPAGRWPGRSRTGSTAWLYKETGWAGPRTTPLPSSPWRGSQRPSCPFCCSPSPETGDGKLYYTCEQVRSALTR